MREGLDGLFPSTVSDAPRNTYSYLTWSTSWSTSPLVFSATGGEPRITSEEDTQERPQTPLSRLSDEEYLEASRRLHEEYLNDVRDRARASRVFREQNEEDRRSANAEYWRNHRLEHPDCDCQRCRTYSGQTGENDEDELGW